MSAIATSGQNQQQSLHNYPSLQQPIQEKLEDWLMDKYKPSTFNTCEGKPLPMIDDPPLHIFVEPKISPHEVHTLIPVSVLWKNSVKLGLDRDRKQGAIKHVPQGHCTAWCARMITVPKKHCDKLITHHPHSTEHPQFCIMQKRLGLMRRTGTIASRYGRKTAT